MNRSFLSRTIEAIEKRKEGTCRGAVRGGIAAALLLSLFLCGRNAQGAVVQGRVADRESGESIAGANVAIPSLRRTGLSDAKGAYRFRDLHPGEYRLEVSSLGHLPAILTVRIDSEEQVVTLDVALEADLSDGVDVVVRGRRSRENEAAARFTEQNSPTVVNVLSAQAMERSTDVSAAEAVQRIPGISITRVQGEARDAIIRGMEARYNNTLVDGVRIPSPSTNSRVVSMDFLPSDLLQRIEVTKVLTPDMEGDAIGGAVNVVMREAPAEPILRVRAGTGYSTMLADRDYIGFRTDSILSDPLERFGLGYRAEPDDFTRDNAKLLFSNAPPDWRGELTAGSRFFGKRLGVLFGGSVQQSYQLSEVVRNYEAMNVDNEPYYTHREYRLHSHNKIKSGLNLKADYILGAKSGVSASFVAFFRRHREARLLSDTNFTFVPILYNKEQVLYQEHNIFSSVLSGRHGFGRFDLRWRGGWAYANQNTPDRAQVVSSNALIGDSVVSEAYFHDFDRDWQHNTDNDIHGSVDLSWGDEEVDPVKVSAGVLARRKSRDNYRNAYRLIPIPDPVTGGIPRYTGLDNIEWQVANVGGTPEFANNNYEARETLAEGYAMASASLGKWRLLGGLRIERTAAAYSTHDVNLLAKVSAEKSYTDILPSLHLRYALSDASNLRLSAGRSISRPDYFDLVPYNYVGNSDLRVRGNPDLNRSVSTNVDLRYELFPTFERPHHFSAGLFYKNIDDPVEMTLDLSNPSLPTLIPKNLGVATNYGVELTVGTTLFDRLALSGNYTFTHSSITSTKIRFDKDAGVTEQLPETRSLQGQSEHIGNLTARFFDEGWGTTAQLGFVFTGSRVAEVSPFYGLDHVQTDFPILDFSAEQRIWRKLSLFLNAANLLDRPYEVRLNNGMLVESERFGQRISVGITYRN